MSSSSSSGRLLAYFRPPVAIEAVWLACTPFVLAIAALLAPIRPFDYFWSLAQGRAIVQLGRIPAENLFLHTLPVDTPFVDQPWPGQLAMYGAYLVGGHGANLVVLAVALALAMVLTIDCSLARGARPRFVALVALAVTPLLVQGAGARTQMFAYPCFALVLRTALRRAEITGRGGLVSAVIATVLWANVHGSFILAPVIFALAGLGSVVATPAAARRASMTKALRALAVVVAATLLNPRGPAVYLYVLRLGQAVRTPGVGIDEWTAPSPGAPSGILFYLLLTATTVWIVLARRRAWLPALLPFLAFALLSLTSQRFLGWWALSAVVALPMLGGVAEGVERSPGATWPNLALLSAFSLLTLASLPGAPLFERVADRSHLPYPEGRALGRETPLRTAEALARGYPGRLFHSQAIGGLVEWTVAARAPRPVAFVDQRFELIPAALWRDYFAICAAEPGWQQRLARYRIGTVLVDDGQAAGLIAALARDPDWRLVGRELRFHRYERVREQSW